MLGFSSHYLSLTSLTPPGPYRATACRGKELNFGSHTYFFDYTRIWRASPDEGSAHYRGHLRGNTNMKDDTHEAHTYTRFLERKICNPLANVADRLKKLRGSRQPYLVNVKIVLM